MRVSIAPAVLADSRYFPILDVIALILEEERHIVDVEELTQLEGSEWISNRPSDLYEVLERVALAASYDSGAHQSIVEIDDEAPVGGQFQVIANTRVTRVRPLEALLFLSTPFQVVVENEEEDGAFLLWMSRVVQKPRLLEAYRRQRFVFRHAGGKDSIVRSLRIFSNGIWARNDGRYRQDFRMWLGAYLDNDAKHGGDQPNAEIVRQALSHGLFAHQLAKRSIESYLPRAALLEFDKSAQFSRKVDAMFRLTKEQLRHYHMKRGFRVEKKVMTKGEFLASSLVSAEEKALYTSVPDADWSLLAEGFGSGLSSIFVDEAHRSDQRMTPSDVDDAKELTSLISEIYKAL